MVAKQRHVIVISPSIRVPQFEGRDSLKYLPFKDYQIHRPGQVGHWAKIVNNHMQDAAQTNRDVLLIDDDVVIHPDTFKDWDHWRHEGDIIGFKLSNLDRNLVHGGGALVFRPIPNNPEMFYAEARIRPDEESFLPAYVPFVCKSLMYIKWEVLNCGIRFKEWAGWGLEEIPFCFEAATLNFRTLFIPQEARHDVAQSAPQIPFVRERSAINMQTVGNGYLTNLGWIAFIASLFPDGINRQGISVNTPPNFEVKFPEGFVFNKGDDNAETEG